MGWMRITRSYMDGIITKHNMSAWYLFGRAKTYSVSSKYEDGFVEWSGLNRFPLRHSPTSTSRAPVRLIQARNPPWLTFPGEPC